MSKIGNTYSRYKITASLGAGGMGEVYLAEDTRLNRKVALKVLPAEAVTSEDRMRRFTQEAQAAAALNHPNIAHIYEIGEHDGTHFIAMEYVDGSTLHDKIHKQKVPLGKLIKYLIQTAEGLAKAHAAGIVHRDLKPENIMVSGDGYVKILDFGLAKLTEPRSPGHGDVSGDTETAILAPRSAPGMILGTAGYMSPEQAQGHISEIDHRSDIFSFGCILYEAVTRRKAFGGKDQIDSLHKIVHAPTPLISDANPDAPADLQRIVRRCLAKEPDKRFQSIKDVAIELEELSLELTGTGDEKGYSFDSDTGPAAPTLSPVPAADSTQDPGGTSTQILSTRPVSSAEYIVSGIRQNKFGFAAAAVVFLTLAGGIGFAVYKYRRTAPDAPRSITIEKLTTEGKVFNAAVSPDGKYAIYIVDDGGQQSLWTKQIPTNSSVQIIPPAEGVEYQGLRFTPDGNFVTFLRRDPNNSLYVLYQMPVLGGTQKKLSEDVDGAVSYSPDGKQIAFIRGNFPEMGASSLMIANADGTGERILAQKTRPDTFPWWPAPSAVWAPDGRTIAAVTGGNITGVGTMNVVEVSVEDGSSRPVTKQGWYQIKQIAWIPDKSGLLVMGAEKASEYFSQQIAFISYPDGQPRRITSDFYDYIGMSLTADGESLAAVQSSRISNIWIVPNLDTAKAVQVKAGGTNQEGTDGLAWAPDGRIVYYSKASGNDDIWIMNQDGTGVKQLTADFGVNYDLKTTPDGRYIVFSSEQNGTQNIWRIDMDGRNPKQLTFGNTAYGVTVTPDSKWLLYDSTDSGTPSVWKVSIDGGEPTLFTRRFTENCEISPDGRLVACQFRENSDASWRYALFTIDGGEPIKIFDLPGGGFYPDFRWSPDGRSLTYRYTSKGVTNIWSYPIDGGQPKQLTDFKNDLLFNFRWSPDGKSLVVARGTTMSDMVMIRNFH